ncbi:unnamed protein product [Peniophora sp. CBMAI 1063]|nr:unnamed protein product [Peniophora sp. CBMAI 1063]
MQGSYLRPEASFAADEVISAPAVSSRASSRIGAPTLEINTIDIQPPSQSTSPNSSQRRSNIPDGAHYDGHFTSTLSPAKGTDTAVLQPPIQGRGSSQIPPLPPGRWLMEITPKDLLWYTRRATTEKRHRDYEVPPLTTTFEHRVPEGREPSASLGAWVPFTHPEGSLYFRHPQKRVWTNAYMFERLYHDEVEECVAYLEEFQYALLDRGVDDDVLMWYYYYADHRSRSIFWLRRRILWKEIEDVKGAFSPDHIYHKVQQFYWHHIFHFPDGRHDVAKYFGPSIWMRLLGCIDFDCLDGIVSPRSTSLFEPAELMQMKKIVQLAHQQSSIDDILPEQLSAVARIQMLRAEQRFINAHGQPFARLDNTDSIYPEADGRRITCFFRAINLLLLHAPFSFLKDLHSVSEDDIILEYAWRRYFARLLDDWDRLVLQGAVVLTANVSFLAIPDVIHFPDQPSGTGGDSTIQAWIKPEYTWSATLSYISTLLSLGSVMSGLLLARHNRPQVEHSTDAAEASRYLARRHSHFFGLEPIAIVYSLPYALMIWGTGFFLAAILSFTFDSTDIATRSIVAVGASVVTGLLFWSICSGKLMLMNKIWLPLANTLVVECVIDAVLHVSGVAGEKKRACTEKLRSAILSMKRGSTSRTDGQIEVESQEAGAQSV